MTLTTLFALFGDDLTKWLTTEAVDFGFQISLIVAFVLFALELLIQSCVVDDFKYSFFFWLDLIATISLIPDIQWFMDFINLTLGLPLAANSLDYVIGSLALTNNNSSLAKVIKSFRLIRLIRIIKLFNYFAKSGADAAEAKLRE